MTSSSKHTVVLIPGDGIGPEVSDAVRKVLDATGAPLEYLQRHAGVSALDAGKDDVLPEDTVRAIREHHVALKGRARRRSEVVSHRSTSR